MMPADRDPSLMLPSTPMTGPASPARRTLPQQDGNGESETDFGVVPSVNPEDYVVPARPSTLRLESEEPTLALQLSRRSLNTGFGPRRL